MANSDILFSKFLTNMLVTISLPLIWDMLHVAFFLFSLISCCPGHNVFSHYKHPYISLNPVCLLSTVTVNPTALLPHWQTHGDANSSSWKPSVLRGWCRIIMSKACHVGADRLQFLCINLVKTASASALMRKVSHRLELTCLQDKSVSNAVCFWFYF